MRKNLDGTAFLKVPTIGIALVAAAAAGFYDFVVEGTKKSQVIAAVDAPASDEDEEYDL